MGNRRPMRARATALALTAFLAVGAAAGLSALLLHALIDFNFHIPANAVVAAVLAGLLFGAQPGAEAPAHP